MACYLGVDGGGSKTAFALVDSTGEILARCTAPSTYYFRDGIAVVEKVLTQGIGDICRQADIDTAGIDAAFFGLPGYGEASADIGQLDAVVGRVLGHDRYSCDNDMVCGWAGSLATEDGINVISGTGSMAYGRRQGAGRRVGGWGELFGDEGSAYWVATQGLNAFSRMSDGRLPRGPLHELLRAALQIDDDLDAVGVVIEKWDGNRRDIAALAATVCAAAQRGDAQAGRILADAADELVALVETARTALGFTAQETVALSYSGGMFSDETFLRLFQAAMSRLPVTYDIRRPVLDPAVGAALYAAKSSGRPLSPDALHHLMSRSHL